MWFFTASILRTFIRVVRVLVESLRREQEIRPAAWFGFYIMGKLRTFPQPFFNEYFSCVQFQRSPGTGFPALENTLGTGDERVDIREAFPNDRKLYSLLNAQINLELTRPPSQ